MEPRSERRLACFQILPLGLTGAQLQRHGQRQVGQLNLDDGIFEPGRRINAAACRQYGIPDQFINWLETGRLLDLLYHPAGISRGNYRSLADAGEAATADYRRQSERGWQEGPLLYTPHHMVLLGWSASQANPRGFRLLCYGPECTLLPLSCQYDTVLDVIPRMDAGAWLWKVDLADAFHHWALTDADADYFGMQEPDGSGFSGGAIGILATAKRPVSSKPSPIMQNLAQHT